mmetsp:Transcript_11380/g.36164  ORF Transcript_11380/g.36164 Transcript_11380/m.36164 type:complete len:222 (+) Transcript_11380:2171-2836(+)
MLLPSTLPASTQRAPPELPALFDVKVVATILVVVTSEIDRPPQSPPAAFPSKVQASTRTTDGGTDRPATSRPPTKPADAQSRTTTRRSVALLTSDSKPPPCVPLVWRRSKVTSSRRTVKSGAGCPVPSKSSIWSPKTLMPQGPRDDESTTNVSRTTSDRRAARERPAVSASARSFEPATVTLSSTMSLLRPMSMAPEQRSNMLSERQVWLTTATLRTVTDS